MWSHRSCLVKAETSCSHQRKFDVVTSGSYLEFSAVSFAVGLRAYWRVTHLDLTQAPSRSRWSAQTKKSWNLNSQHPSTTPRKAPIKSFLQHLTTQFLLGKSQVLIAQVLLFATGMHKKNPQFLVADIPNFIGQIFKVLFMKSIEISFLLGEKPPKLVGQISFPRWNPPTPSSHWRIHEVLLS